MKPQDTNQPHPSNPDAFDRVLCNELRWEAPPELTARLLALIPGAPLLVVRPRPHPGISALALAFTGLVMLISMLIAPQIYGQLLDDFTVSMFLAQLQHAPSIFFAWLAETFPLTSLVLALLEGVRDQLHWLILALVLWVAFDKQPVRTMVQ